MSEREGLERLHADLVAPVLPAPELLARYARDPNGLSRDERELVEAAMARSPEVVDEIDTLRGFDPASLHDAESETAGWTRFLALLGGPRIWAPTALAVALVLWLLAPGDPEPRPPRVAETLPTPPVAPLPEPVPAPGAEAPATQVAEAPPAEPPGTPPPSAPPDVNPDPPPPIELAMTMPRYAPAWGADPLGAGDWVTRSSDTDTTALRTLAPEHLTRTLSASPTLHWSVNALPSAGAFYLTLIGDGDAVLALDEPLPAPSRPGLQRVSLAQVGLDLPAGQPVRWSVALRPAPEEPPIAFDFGWIRFEPPSAGEAAGLPPASGGHGTRVAPLAALGCFHDALDAALQAAERHPDDPRPPQAVADLLTQAGVEPAVLR